MNVLERWAGLLAMVGGTSVALFATSLSFQPDPGESPVIWAGLFAGIALLGVAVVGLYRRTRSAVGRLGRASAWLSGLGALGMIAMVLYLFGTGQMVTIQEALPEGPAGALVMASSLAWLAGNLGFAAAIVRARALPRPGAWLVLAGAVVPVALTPLTASGASSPLDQVATVAFLLLPLGWIVLGLSAARSPVTVHATSGA